MKVPSSLHVVDGGDHSLMVRKRELSARKATQTEIDQGVSDAISHFISGLK